MAEDRTQRDEIQWSVPHLGQLLRFEHDTAAPVVGVMDMRTADCSVIWVHMIIEGAGRRLLHDEDGYRLAGVQTAPGEEARMENPEAVAAKPERPDWSAQSG